MFCLSLLAVLSPPFFFFFFFNDTATTEIYTLSLHDALPIWSCRPISPTIPTCWRSRAPRPDRKSTRLNSSHVSISYAVFCLKKKILFYFLFLLIAHKCTFYLSQPDRLPL